ncbi:MAG: phasin family protein [Rhodoferax sp.]|nr:phasin family protein [Rhodoferax sp.]
MNTIIEQFTAANQANLKALESLATKTYAGAEKLAELNMATAKAVLGESFAHAKAVAAAKDAQELIALQTGLFQPTIDKSAAYLKHVQTIAAASGAEFTKVVEAKTAEAQKAFGEAVDKIAKNAPAGTETAVAAFKTALTAGQNAVETAQASAKKAAETAQASFNSAATQAVEAVKKATTVA